MTLRWVQHSVIRVHEHEKVKEFTNGCRVSGRRGGGGGREGGGDNSFIERSVGGQHIEDIHHGLE